MTGERGSYSTSTSSAASSASVAVVGDDEDHRLTDVVDRVARQRALRARLLQPRMRDQQGQQYIDVADVLACPDSVHAWQRPGALAIDPHDASVRERAADERRMQCVARIEVVDVEAVSLEQACVLIAQHRLAELASRHDYASSP